MTFECWHNIGCMSAADCSRYRLPISARCVAELHIRHRADIGSRCRADIESNIWPMSGRYQMFAGHIRLNVGGGTLPGYCLDLWQYKVEVMQLEK